MSNLDGKHVLLGVSGSIAAYKAVDILRTLQEQGAEVRVLLTANAERFVSRLTIETLTGHAVLSADFPDRQQQGIGHIDITDDIDVAIVAPATANIIGKVASGIADDTLSTALMAIRCPLIIAPAMNDRMYGNPIVQKNIAFLKEHGVRFIEPGTGQLACGAIGKGRLADIALIVSEVSAALPTGSLEGVTVLVTAGPTREPIDAVRFISNPSTGTMGYALAAEAQTRGAKVILVSGPTDLMPPSNVSLFRINTAAEMLQSTMEHLSQADIVIMAAAVSDFKPAVSFPAKVKKQEAQTVIELERTQDILSTISKVPGKRFLVGFAAETDDLEGNAIGKLREKNLDMIVANDLLKQGAGFGLKTNSVTIIERSGAKTELPVMPKREIASRVIEKITEVRKKQRFLP